MGYRGAKSAVSFRGIQDNQSELFSCQLNLEKWIRQNNPLRAVSEKVDFAWVRDEVAQHYGYNGNESTDPVVILNLLFLLFFGNVKSERELMRIVPERLDYLWFLGYGLDDDIPHHSVLSKARGRWGARDLRAVLRPHSLAMRQGGIGGRQEDPSG